MMHALVVLDEIRLQMNLWVVEKAVIQRIYLLLQACFLTPSIAFCFRKWASTADPFWITAWSVALGRTTRGGQRSMASLSSVVAAKPRADGEVFGSGHLLRPHGP